MYTVNDEGTIRAVDIEAGVLGPVHAEGQRANALGVSVDGAVAYTLDNSVSSAGLEKQIAIHDAITGETVTKSLGDPRVPGVLIRGAVSPATGLYYYGGDGVPSYLGAYDPEAAEAIGQVGFLATSRSGNGDFAFGANGDLYVLKDDMIGRVAAGDLPTRPGSEPIPLTEVATLPDGTLGNGIAFGANGRLFVSQHDRISEVDLATGSLTRTFDTGDFGNTDLASCSFPNTLTLQKDVVDRFAESDQFALAIGAPEGTITATTTGSATGIQDTTVGPIFVSPGVDYRISESAASGADLANYESSVTCVDQENTEVPMSGQGSDLSVTIPSHPSGTNVVCTIVNDAKPQPGLVPGFTLEKHSDPATGTSVLPGSTIEYTIVAANTGETRLDPVTVSDDLSGVFAHADLVGEPVTEIDGVAVTDGRATISYATHSDATLNWVGSLEQGQTATITYSVTVHRDASGVRIKNRATAAATDPETDEEITGPEVVTEHEVPEPSVNPKAPDPELPGSPKPDDQLATTGDASVIGALSLGAALLGGGALALLIRRRDA
ncbi:DUF7507 domain-containing protein [Leucobacter luti]|uniref:DUF7927 domain-containing protein n=1 Tax=Leucobacter luti TaxID=340320 RepID=UPI003D069836